MSIPRKKTGDVVPKVGNGLRAVPRRAVPNSNNDLTDKPKYDDWLPSALGQLAADIAGAWDNKPTPYKRRRIALLLDELLSLIEADADVQQIFTRLPFALDKGLILQSFYSRVFPPPPEPPTEPEPTDVRLDRGEREVLQAMADGLFDNKTIARLIPTKITEQTVNTYRRNIHRKLGAQDKLEAVAKGVRLGLVRFDAIKFVNNITREKFTWIEHNPLFEGFLVCRSMKPDAQSETDRRMRLLHLLSVILMIASYLALSISAPPADLDAAGAICELNPEGEVVRCFNGEDALNYPNAITVAPPQASQQGFAPGNLFVVDACTNPDLFNADRIVELTPEGKFVRALTGSSTFGTRLTDCAHLTFGADGSLFAGSGAATDAVLRFTAGGAQVQRFGVPISAPSGIASTPNGDVYALSYSSTRGNVVYVFDSNGDTVRKWRLPAVIHPGGCVVDSHGNLLVGDLKNNRLLTFSPTGDKLASFPCPSLHRYFALTPDGKLYVTEYPTNVLRGFNREGKLLKTVKVEPLQGLNGVAVGEDGRIWVCGRKGKEEEEGGNKGK